MRVLNRTISIEDIKSYRISRVRVEPHIRLITFFIQSENGCLISVDVNMAPMMGGRFLPISVARCIPEYKIDAPALKVIENEIAELGEEMYKNMSKGGVYDKPVFSTV